MNTEPKHYKTSSAVESAIKSAAKTVNGKNPARGISDLIRQTDYDRFLCRIFSEGDCSDWVLKGGSAMLARIPSTRRTLDADLFEDGYDAEESLEDLKRLASIDLGDFFRFEFVSARPILQGGNQPYADGYRVTFKIFLGTKLRGAIHVDLATHVGALPRVDVEEPQNRLPLQGLKTVPYRLFPLPCQFADKVCAIVERVNGEESTRVKDLVDLAIIATTQTIDGVELIAALRTEIGKRALGYPIDFEIPRRWTEKEFRNNAYGTSVSNLGMQEAAALIRKLLDEVQKDACCLGVWDPCRRIWVC